MKIMGKEGGGGSWEPTFIPSQSNFKPKNKIEEKI